MLPSTAEQCPPVDHGSAEALWAQWLRERSPAARNALALHYRVWVNQIAARLYGRFRYALAEFADYANLASIGLLSAIESYRPELNVPFEAYAFHRVRGAVLNGLSDYASEYKKSGAGSGTAGQSYLAELEQDDFGPDPLPLVVEAAVGLALGRFLELGVVDPECDPDPLALYQSGQEMLGLWALVARLPERECLVLTEHYRHQKCFKDIAETLGVSRPRVAQLHYQALRRLKQLHETLG